MNRFQPREPACDLVLTGARVIDPESGLDGVRDVGITGDRIVDVSTSPLVGHRIVDVAGLVLAPGFIDLHSHALNVSSMSMQALDGVTTVFDLEGGALSVGAVVREAAAEGRPLNFGYSASWAMARMLAVGGAPHAGAFEVPPPPTWGDAWQRPADDAVLARVLERLSIELSEGAIGIGVLLGYAPETRRIEFYRVAQLAAAARSGVFAHARSKNAEEPGTALEGIAELIAVAAGTGAHLHVCHLNSTSLRSIDEVAQQFEGARDAGLPLSTEVYPYGAGMTMVTAPFLHPDNLSRLGIRPGSLEIARTRERPASAARLEELRAARPELAVIAHYLDTDVEADRRVLVRALQVRGAVIASDAIPFQTPDGRTVRDTWPLPRDVVSHPRSSGTFARAVGPLVRDWGVYTLPEAIARCTLEPARILESLAPRMRSKGRVRPGADADLVVFDAARLRDRATYAMPAQASEGVRHLLVNGEFVVRDGDLLDARPGRAILGGAA